MNQSIYRIENSLLKSKLGLLDEYRWLCIEIRVLDKIEPVYFEIIVEPLWLF